MRIEVRAVVEVPDNTPMEAIEEWVQYELGAGALMATQIPPPMATSNSPT